MEGILNILGFQLINIDGIRGKRNHPYVILQ